MSAELRTVSSLEHEVAMGKVWLLFLVISAFIIVALSNEILVRADHGARREVLLRVAYEDYSLHCGQHCIVIDGYRPLELRAASNGMSATPAQFAKAQALARNMVMLESANTDLSLFNVTIGNSVGDPSFDWAHIGG